MKDNKHEFALFYSELSTQQHARELSVADKTLLQRIGTILRLKIEDQLILFNRNFYAHCVLKKIDKKHCLFSVKSWHATVQLQPSVTVLLPVLKREALESAIYSCVALGASVIQLVKTEKTRTWQGEKELERLQRIVVAAAEQSKHFAFPEIKLPLSLFEALEQYRLVKNKIFADPEGVCFSEVLKKCESKKDFLVCVGPEGDLTNTEKKMLKDQFTFCKLTLTILKSEQAVALLLGAVRIVM